MEVLYPRCAGLDVHAGSVTACARIAAGPQVTYEHRTVPTTTRGLLDLAEWLSETTARVLIAEIGTDMSRFPPVGHLISWAGFCPRLDESAGKGRSTRTRKTSPWLKPTLINAAWAATRKKDCYLRAQFLRIKGRRGAKTAILAVASSMLTAAYFMLRDGVEYHDLGPRHFEQRDKEHLAKRLLQRLRDLGVAVEVKAA